MENKKDHLTRAAIDQTHIDLVGRWCDDLGERINWQCSILYGSRHGFE